MKQKPAYAIKLREARQRAGMSQEALSRASGLSRYTIILIEHEGRQPTLKSCQALCAALNISLDELFGAD